MSLLDSLAVEAHHGFDEVNHALQRAGLGDGLPVVPPTPARVAGMLGGRDPERSVAVLAPSREAGTLHRLALCAVLAGCTPPLLPVLAAAVEAAADPAFNLLGVATTTGNAAVALIVHGPAAALANVSGAGNALAGGTGGTIGGAALGRALALVLRTVGGAVPGRTDMATLGQPAKFTCCFAEREDASPWEPLHASRGLPAGQGAVTLFAMAGLLEIADAASTDGSGVLATCAESMLSPGVGVHVSGNNVLLGGGMPLLLLAPEHAQQIARTHTRAQAQAALQGRARLPLERLAPDVRAHLLASLPPGSSAPDALPVAACPEDVLLAVVGGVGRKSAYLPNWSGGSRAVTRPVTLA